MDRLKPHELLCEVSDQVIGAGRSWPNIRRDDNLPALVYHLIAPDVRANMAVGPVVIREYIRVEIQAKQYDETRDLFSALVNALRKKNRLFGITGGLDEYDEALGLHRYIATLVIG